LLNEVKKKEFANGCVYALKTEDEMPIEVTDTFLPYYTKDAVGENQNALTSCDLGDRSERWMVGVSTMSGCPVGCKFCATGQLKKWRRLSFREINEQVSFIINKAKRCPEDSKEFKINYTRMGEPFLNLENVRYAIDLIDSKYDNIHHYVSTIGIRGSDFSWIRGNVTLQISLHSLNEERRRNLIPFPNLMSLEELGKIRTKSHLKTTLNLTLVDELDFDIKLLKKHFDPEYFFIKLSPINVNSVSEENGLGEGIIKSRNLV
jgi:23S rRNA (adenine2503-C2)-methyltransferase